MLAKFNFDRFNTVLLSKDTISRKQHDVRTQQQSHLETELFSAHPHNNQQTNPGEILIELGFIDRARLKIESKMKLFFCKITLICAFILCASEASAVIVQYDLPTTIQADAYSIAFGVKNEPTTDVGGGNNTGAIDAGDWMSYLNKQINVPTTGYYYIYYRVSSLRGGGSFVFNDIASTTIKVDSVTVPKTNGWQTWVTVQRKIYLKAGAHYFGVKAVTGGFNLNWFKIVAVPAAPPVVSSVSSSKSSVKSSSSSSKSSVASSKSSSIAVVKPSASSIKSNANTSTASSVKSSSASSKKSSSAASLDPLYTHIEGSVGLSWAAPTQRENKAVLDITELGGYQLRYKSLADKNYTYVVINDPWTRTYNFSWLEGDYVFQIAAFDKLGVLSDFTYFAD
jgi:hypothetical protein